MTEGIEAGKHSPDQEPPVDSPQEPGSSITERLEMLVRRIGSGSIGGEAQDTDILNKEDALRDAVLRKLYSDTAIPPARERAKRRQAELAKSAREKLAGTYVHRTTPATKNKRT